MSQKSISREISIGQSQDDINRNIINPNLPEPKIAEYQNSLPAPPNQINLQGPNQQRFLTNAEISSLSQRRVSHSARRFSGDEDSIGVIASSSRRRSKSAERYMAQRSQGNSLDGWRHFDELTNEHFDSSSGSFPSNRNYRESRDNSMSKGYEMKTTRISRTYMNEAYDDASFV